MTRKLAIFVLVTGLVLVATPIFAAGLPGISLAKLFSFAPAPLPVTEEPATTVAAPSGNDHQWQCESWGEESFCWKQLPNGYMWHYTSPCWEESGHARYKGELLIMKRKLRLGGPDCGLGDPGKK